MPVGDHVKLGMGGVQISDLSIPVYELMKTPNGDISFDHNGAARPVIIGGVKGGSVGEIVGEAIKVPKTLLKGFSEGSAAMTGNEYVLMIPVYINYYQKIGWFPSDHVRIHVGDVAHQYR